MPLLPDAAIDDGLLDVVLLHPQAVPVLDPAGLPGARQAAADRRAINRMTGRTVVIRAAADTPRQLDGDSIGAGRELQMECSTAGSWSACRADSG